MQTRARTLIAIVVALMSLGAVSERVREPGVTDTEIRIGNVMPYSGNLEIFGAIGKAQAAYFEMINERGGINGRKIRFMSYDDLSDSANAMDLARILVEIDNVLLMFGSFGTPGNLAVRKYLNERQVPQLFFVSGDWPAQAQMYDSAYPVCLQTYGPQSGITCRFTSMALCRTLASGRSAQCIANPYYGKRRRPG